MEATDLGILLSTRAFAGPGGRCTKHHARLSVPDRWDPWSQGRVYPMRAPIRHFQVDNKGDMLWAGHRMSKEILVQQYKRNHDGEWQSTGEADVGLDVRCVLAKADWSAV